MGAGKPDRKRTVFVMVDIQEKFVPVIRDIKEVMKNANILARAADILGIPFIFTEQYSKGLGRTVQDIKTGAAKPIEKMHFSCMECPEFLERLIETRAKDMVLFGIESHVCVLKTALDALEKGFRVHVVADAVSSRRKEDRKYALDRMRQSGAYTVTTEMILFQLMEKAGTDEFRKISSLVR